MRGERRLGRDTESGNRNLVPPRAAANAAGGDVLLSLLLHRAADLRLCHPWYPGQVWRNQERYLQIGRVLNGTKLNRPTDGAGKTKASTIGDFAVPLPIDQASEYLLL